MVKYGGYDWTLVWPLVARVGLAAFEFTLFTTESFIILKTSYRFWILNVVGEKNDCHLMFWIFICLWQNFEVVLKTNGSRRKQIAAG